MMNPLLTPEQAAEQIGVTERWLRRRRETNQPPRFIRVGRLVRYHPEDLAAWVESCRSAEVDTRPPAVRS